MLATYLSRFSSIADNKINCGPVLTWMEVSLRLIAASIRESLRGHDPIYPFQYLICSFNISIKLPACLHSADGQNSAVFKMIFHLQAQGGGVASSRPASRCWHSVTGPPAASVAGTDSWQSELTDCSSLGLHRVCKSVCDVCVTSASECVHESCYTRHVASDYEKPNWN